MPLAQAQASSDAVKAMACNVAPLRYAGDAVSETPNGPPPAGERRRLDSWKEIAAYLGRGIRTVQRWEREEGLPVHRLAHADRGSVFADSTELTEWWKSREIAPAAKPSPAVDAPPNSRLQRVTTTTAATFWPSLSSDGRMVVYVSDAGQDGATPQVWLQQVGGSAVQLTTGMRECAEPAFSHDDTRVIFTASADSTRHVYEVPTFGGQPRVLKRMARGARFAPDGKRLVYLAIDSHDAVRIVSADGDEHVVPTGLVDVEFATWSDDCRHLLVVGHPDRSADLDCWIVPVDGGAPVDTGVFRQSRQRGSIIVSMAVAWTGDAIFFTAAGRQGVHLWRQRVSPTTFEASGSPELMTPGADSAFFPTVARRQLGFVGVHADTNMWSVGIDLETGLAQGQPRRLTRGGGLVSSFSVSSDGNTLAYFGAGSSGAAPRIRDVRRGTDAVLEGEGGDNRGFPVISLDGKRLAFGTLVAGPPVRRPVFVANLADGASRLIFEDCGGRPRLWLDDELLLAETFGAGLNSFVVLDTRKATQRPLLSSRERRLSNPRLSPDAQWLAFDATLPGGSPSVLLARLDDGHAAEETAWIRVETDASHPFWSRDGRLLYYLPATPTVDIRNRVVARSFDPGDGSVGTQPIDVLALSEMIVPAMIGAAAPIVAGDQIVFLLANYRGDIWIMDV
jgi:Tol biopolymer transport system component